MLRYQGFYLAQGGSPGGHPADPVAVSRALLEKAPILVYCLDLAGRTVTVNQRFRDVTGWDVPDLPDGERILQALYPSEPYRQVVRALHDNWRENKHVRDQVTTIADRAGAYHKVSWSSARLRDAQGRTVGYIAMGIDVSEEKHLEQWARLQTGVMERLSEGVVVVNLEGQIISWAGGAPSLLGFGPEHRLGQSAAVLFPEESRDSMDAQVLAGLATEGRFEGDLPLLRADGPPLTCHLQVHLLRNEHIQEVARLYSFSTGEVSAETSSHLEALEAHCAALAARAGELEGRLAALGQDAAQNRSAWQEADAQWREADRQLKEAQEALARSQAEAQEAQARLRQDTDEKLAALQVAADGERRALEALLEEAQAEAARSLMEQKHTLEADHQGRLAELRHAWEAEIQARLADQRQAFDANFQEQFGAAEARYMAELEELRTSVRNASEEAAASVAITEQKFQGAMAEAQAAWEQAERTSTDLTRVLHRERAEHEAAQSSLRREAEARLSSLEARHQGELEEIQAERQKELQAQIRTSRQDWERREGEIRAEAVARIQALEQELASTRASAEAERIRAADAMREERDRSISAAAHADRLLAEALTRQATEIDTKNHVEVSRLIAEAESLRAVVNASHEEATAQLNKRYEMRERDLRAAAESAHGEARRARASGERLIQHLEYLQAIAVIVCDASGRIQAWSAGAETATGYGRDQALGRLLHEEVLRVPGLEWARLYGAVTQEQHLHRAIAYLDRNGTQRIARLEVLCIPGDGGNRVVEIIRDASDRAALEEALFEERAMGVVGRLTVLFRGQMERLSEALNHDLDRIERDVRDLGQVVATWRSGAPAHEIEDRVRAIDLDAILRNLPRLMDDTETRRRDLRNLAADLRRYVAALEAGEGVDAGRFPIHEAVESALHLATGDDLPQFVLERHYGEPPALRGRGHLLFPLLTQVFGTAAHHLLLRDTDRRLVIRTQGIQGRAVLEIHHSGKVASPEDLKDLASPVRATVAPGVGPSGLAYATWLAHLAGGTLLVTPEEDSTTYRLDLPAAPAGPAPPAWRLDLAADPLSSLRQPLPNPTVAVPSEEEVHPSASPSLPSIEVAPTSSPVEVNTELLPFTDATIPLDFQIVEHNASDILEEEVVAEEDMAAEEEEEEIAAAEAAAALAASHPEIHTAPAAAPLADIEENDLGDLELMDDLPVGEPSRDALISIDMPGGSDETLTSAVWATGDISLPATLATDSVDVAMGDVMEVTDLIADSFPDSLVAGESNIERIEIDAQPPVEIDELSLEESGGTEPSSSSLRAGTGSQGKRDRRRNRR